jgi:sugar/nucleoside kinase (ribokinase family)
MGMSPGSGSNRTHEGEKGSPTARRPNLIVVGDVMIDVSVASGALAPGGDVHGDVRLRPGGSGPNAAVWAAASGMRVRLHGRIGSDLAGRMVCEALQERGVDPAMTVDHEAPTGAMLVVHQPGERSMVASRGANARFAPGDLPSGLEADAVLVSGYLLFHPDSEPATRLALERARAPLVAVDAASWPLVEAYGPGRFLEATEGADLVLANEREAQVLTGLEGEAAVLTLGARYRIACVKLGSSGAAVAHEGRIVRVPSPTVEEVDPTGAGDAFNGVFVSGLVRGQAMLDVLAHACDAGARVAAAGETWPVR